MEQISYDQWKGIQMVVGVVLTAEPIPKSSKLYQLKVDLGEAEPRQIVSGLQPYYTAEELIGRQVVVLANLAPAKLMGVESNGMLLCATNHTEGAEDFCVLLAPERAAKPGTAIT